MTQPRIGRFAKVTLGDETILNLANYKLDETADELDASVFGTGWGATMPGQQKWKVSLDGFLDEGDETGQLALRDAKRLGSLITDIKFYIDNTSYATPDLTNDSDAGCYVISRSIDAANNGLVKVTYTLGGVGPICEDA